MPSTKKIARQRRALERLEGRIELDGLGFPKSPNNSRNTWSDGQEHYRLRERLGLNPPLVIRPHPSDWYRHR